MTQEILSHPATPYPAHASPALPPHSSGSPVPQSDYGFPDPPPSLLSPAFTPPYTPGTVTPALLRDAQSYPVDASSPSLISASKPKLLSSLPKVSCQVRARIPTSNGQEVFLHVYRNDTDEKEHLAIVYSDEIRSRSLFERHPGETEYDRMIRGAYSGRLHPGRIDSRVAQIQREHGVAAASAHPAASTIRTTNNHNSCEEVTLQDFDHKSPLVRIHSECYTGETVWSARCDCGEQLDEAHRLLGLPCNIAAGGVIIYLRQEGRGIGLPEKLKAYNLQDLGYDTYEANLLLRHPADARSYGLATAMLIDLGLGGDRGIRLLTNNPDKIRAVEGPSREVIVKERVAMVPLAWKTGGKSGINSDELDKYLSTKVCTALRSIDLYHADFAKD